MSLFHRNNRNKKGFTLIEMMITVSIFAFMTALVIIKYGTFNQGTLLTNMAYDVALAVRTAQTFGVSVRGMEDQTTAFDVSYGVLISEVSMCSDGINNQKFILYQEDKNQSAYFSCDSYKYSTYNLKRGAKISDICVGDSSTSCSTNPDNISIVFKRPDPSAIIRSSSGTRYAYAKITIKDSTGETSRDVEIRRNGQISVKTN